MHYPKQKVVGINVNTLIMILNSSAELSNEHIEDATNSVHMRCHLEFIMALLDSPIFVDILVRHGCIIDPFV